ncbi:MAG: hypothetical protein ABIO81_07615 [Ginsengibacter sp.]
MKTKFLGAIAILFCLGVNSADAQIKHRAQNQNHRVRQGVKSGELTKREVRDLREDRKDLRQDVKLAKSDGKVTAGERKIIKKEQRKDSREIYRKKHNNRDRN